MAIDFPNSPSTGDTYTAGDRTWIWDGSVWASYGNFPDPTVLKVDKINDRVGINNVSPAVTLDVTGDAAVSGDLDVTGTIAGGSTTFPTTLDSGTMPAIEALQAKVGADSSAVTSSLDYKVSTLETDVTALNTGYRYHSTVYFTSSGTFTKASYPWLRAIRVKVQGAGGGGGSAARTTGSFGVNHGAAGAAGAYAERFITDIAGLAASETVTVGSGGAGGANPDTSDVYNVGSNGGSSSAFGLTAGGGQGGNNADIASCCGYVAEGGQPSGTYDFGVHGEGGNFRRQNLQYKEFHGAKDYVYGGMSYLSVPGRSVSNNGAAYGNTGYGFGGNPGKKSASTVGGNALSGGDGVVIVELYA